jgi:DNA-binding FadR family transcriptional regulator
VPSADHGEISLSPTADNRGNSGYVRHAHRIAELLIKEVRESGWPVGEILGSESELMARYGVSRPVLREAVRLVEQRNVAVMRKGPGGGLKIMAPDSAPIVDAAALYLEYRGIKSAELFSTKRRIEVITAELAANNITEEGVARLRSVLDAEQEFIESGQDTEESVGGDEFHIVVAELSGDQILALFAEVLTKLAPHHVVLPHDHHALALAMHGTHRKIADAIIAGDAMLAQHRISKHLLLTENYLR